MKHEAYKRPTYTRVERHEVHVLSHLDLLLSGYRGQACLARNLPDPPVYGRNWAVFQIMILI